MQDSLKGYGNFLKIICDIGALMKSPIITAGLCNPLSGLSTRVSVVSSVYPVSYRGLGGGIGTVLVCKPTV